MALRVPIPAVLRSYSQKKENREIRTSVRVTAKTNVKQQRKGVGISPDVSPFRTIPEEIASRFGLEMTILELERIFKRDGGDPLLPQLAGPSHPFLAPGFSGRPVRVAYQGVLGSYCQEAAVEAFSSVCDAFPCNHMEDAFQVLEEKTADRAIIPAENSIDGPIDRNFDLLLRHGGIEIVGELILPVNHCLLALPGSTRSDLKRVVSHPQALSHCKAKLESLDLEIDEVSNAADAAKFVSENQIADTAVIGSKIAAREFGLQILEQNVQDEVGNFNRFLQLGLENAPVVEGRESKSNAWKTTVAFSLEKGVSDLFRALWAFESRNVTVTRVEHRPNRLNPVRVLEKDSAEFRYFDYVFILDLEGRVSDRSVESGIAQLKEISGFLRVLGSYALR